MKIKVAILEMDQGYLERIAAVFGTKYADKFELYSFTSEEAAIAALEPAKIDVLVASDVFEIDISLLPERCGFAYFVDFPDVQRVRDQAAICKFQKAELIYKQILGIYAEKASGLSGLQEDDGNTRVFLFHAVSGGTGVSSMAAACALYFAQQHKRALYLNLEKFGTADVFFSGEGQLGLSDIIYALKSRKSNFQLKLESCVRRDPRGVCFYSQAGIALDMMELSWAEAGELTAALKLTGMFDYIIVDADFELSKKAIEFYKQMHSILWVGDGSEISNTKLARAYEALSALEQNAVQPLTSRISLIYNKFSNKTGRTLENTGLREIGGAPRYDHADTAQVLDRLSRLEIFGKIERQI